MASDRSRAKTIAVVLLKRFVGLLCLTLLPLGSLAQTVAILNLSIAKEPHQGARFIGVEVSLLNETNTAITLNNELFYLADPHDVIYRSLSRIDNSPVTFSDPLNPGSKISQHLWFEVPADVDYNTLRLCLHAADSKIPLYSPEAMTAPMLHPGVATEPTSAMSYARIMKDLVPPKLLFAVDPKLPRGGNEMLKNSSGKITSTVSLVVDRQGAPRQILLMKSGGSDFDREAIRAVSRYRFKPATDQEHNPVAVRVNIEVTFRSY
jgi:TonB family protein